MAGQPARTNLSLNSRAAMTEFPLFSSARVRAFLAFRVCFMLSIGRFQACLVGYSVMQSVASQLYFHAGFLFDTEEGGDMFLRSNTMLRGRQVPCFE
jgi:hypothetical protein